MINRAKLIETKIEKNSNKKPPNFLTLKEAFKHPRFYHLAIMLFNGLCFGLYVASVEKITA